MTTINPITSGKGSGASGLYGASPTSSSGTMSFNSKTFLQLLVSEMQNQSPLSPMNSNTLMTQVATLTETSDIQTLTGLQRVLAQLTEAESATGLLGRAVQGSNASGQVSGVVQGVLPASGQGSPELVLNTASGRQRVALSTVGAVASNTSALQQVEKAGS